MKFVKFQVLMAVWLQHSETVLTGKWRTVMWRHCTLPTCR